MQASCATAARSRRRSPTPAGRSLSVKRERHSRKSSGPIARKRNVRLSTLRDLPATTPESVALSKQLKRNGFRFVGPHDGVRGDAGLRRRQRPHRRLPRARRRPAGHRDAASADARRARAERPAATRGRGRGRTRARPAGGRALAASRADDRAVPLRTRRAADGTARCSRSAARAATRRSGSPRACGLSADTCSRSSTIRPRSKPGGRTSRRPGSRSGPSSIEGDAFETLPRIEDVFDVVFLDAEKEDYEQLFQARARRSSSRARSSSPTTSSRTRRPLGSYSQARQADPSLESRHRAARPRASSCSVDPPRRADTFALTAERRWSESGDFQYGQWRYQRVEACPRTYGESPSQRRGHALRAARPCNSRAEAGSASTNPPLVTGSGPHRRGPLSFPVFVAT